MVIHMKRYNRKNISFLTLFSWVSLFYVAAPSSAFAIDSSEMLVRGRFLGMNIEDACKDTPIYTDESVLDRADDREKATLISLGYSPTRARTCAPKLGVPNSIDGIQTDNDLLISVDEKLVALAYTIEKVSSRDAAAYVAAQTATYGKPIKSSGKTDEGYIYKYLWGNEKKGDHLVSVVTLNFNDAQIKTRLVRNPDFSRYRQQMKKIKQF